MELHDVCGASVGGRGVSVRFGCWRKDTVGILGGFFCV